MPTASPRLVDQVASPVKPVARLVGAQPVEPRPSVNVAMSPSRPHVT
jgi:hypothetical protein